MKSIFIFGEKNILINYFNSFSQLGYKVIISKDVTLSDNCNILLLAGGGDICPFFYGEKDYSCRSKDAFRDLSELELIWRFIVKNKPIIGICRGLQVINVYFKGSLFQDVFGHSQINEKDILHKISLNPKGCLYPIFGKELFVNSAHHQCVKKLGENLVIDAVSKGGIIEALHHSHLPILAFQFHPERMENKNLLFFINNYLNSL